MFKKNLAKNLILSLVILFILGIYFICQTSAVNAAFGLDQSFKQVKTTDNPTVYYLNHQLGLKKAYVSETAFLAYGNKWTDVKIVSAEELNKWPETRLVKSTNSNQVFYIRDGKKALIESEQQFIDSGFKWSDIVTIAAADLAEYKIAADFKVAGASGNFGDSQLVIALDALSPAADYLVANTQDNLVAIFNLKAGDRLVEIKQLTFDLKGVFNPDIIKEAYLTNESDIKYSLTSSPNNRQVSFNFNNQPVVINPGETKKLKVYLNFNDSTESIVGQTLQLGVNQATNIAGAKAVGSFPLFGETFKLTSVAGFLEKVIAKEEPLAIKNNQALIGSTEKNIGKFSLAETSVKAEVYIKELKFVDNGNVSAASLNNFKLKNRSGQVVSTVAVLTSDKELVFKLNNYKIKKKDSETFTISADIKSGENSTLNFDLAKAVVASSQGNFNLSVDITNLSETITIKRETVGVVAKELKGNNKVFAQQTGLIIGNFEIRNNNQVIDLNRLNISLEKSASAPSLTETVYLVNYNSGAVYASFNGDRFNTGAVNIGLNGLSLKVKENLVLALVTELPSSAPNGSYYKIILNSLDYRLQNGAFLSDTINSAGAKLTISKSSLYLYANNDLGDQSFIKGQKNVKIASFIIEGAAGGDTRISSLTFSQGTDSSGVISFDNGFSNLKFYIGSTMIKSIKFPYAGDIGIEGFSYTLKSGARAEIKVYADTDTDLRASSVQLAISNVAAVNKNSAIPAVINNLNVNSHQVAFGQASAEISKVADGFVTKGENDNVVAAFKVKNTGVEDLKLNSITINSADQELTYSIGYSNLKVVDRIKQKSAGKTISKPVAGANKISLNGYIVKAGEEVVFDVHVKTSNLVADENIDIYFSDFSAQGKTSKVAALISGSPTDNFSFTVAVGSKNNTGAVLIKPVSGKINYGFHDPNYPYIDSVGQHTGIDIALAQGTPVKASADGLVVDVFDGGLTEQASYITIKHDNNLVTNYAHLTRLDVKVGDSVKQGDTIGLSGGTPGTNGAGAYTNGAHLHFEVLLNNALVDPEKYF